jgi:uncharacterized protein DUF7033
MKALIIYSNTRFFQHIEYVFNHVLHYLGIVDIIYLKYEEYGKSASDADIILSYGDEPPPGHISMIHIEESELFSSDYLKPRSLPAPPLDEWKGLPIIFGSRPDSGDWVEENESGVISHIDFIAGIFYLLTGYEEIVLSERDEFSRFPAELSFLADADLLDRPIVDEYSDFIASRIEKFIPSFKRKDQWSGHPFALYVTHDVDAPFKYSWKKVLGFGQTFTRGLPSLLNRTRDPYWTFPELLKLDSEFGIEADYFFMAGGKHALDSSYAINEPCIVKLFKEIREKKNRIGIHFSLSSHLHLVSETEGNMGSSQFAKELTHFIAVAHSPAVGSRQHYLGLHIPQTWCRLDSLAIPFDTTVAFSTLPGFRCGTCRPFRCFDAENGVNLRLFEVPLIAMDATFIYHLKLSPEEALARMISLMDHVEKRNGVFCLLWHSHTLCEEDFPGWAGVYRDFLRAAMERNPFSRNPVSHFMANAPRRDHPLEI